jgi:hypothetical protein
MRRWIGYDWFKLIIAVILALLLLIFWLNDAPAPAVVAPAAPAPAVPTAIAAPAAPEPAAQAPATLAPAAQAPATLAPAAPAAITAPALTSPSGSAIAPGALTFSGTAAPNTTVQVLVDGQPIGSATADAAGAWSLGATLDQPGDHTVVVQALDSAGAVAAAAEPITIELSAPAAEAAPPVAAGAAPAIGFPADGAQIPSGRFTMTGTGAPGSQIDVLDSDKLIGSVTVAADGSWSLPVTPSDGTAAYSARPAGSADSATTPIRVTIGVGAPAVCDSLRIGCDAWVTRQGGQVLRLRAGAGTGQPILAGLPVGTQVKLLEGAQVADGYSWWRVATLGGREGWVAGEELRARPD